MSWFSNRTWAWPSELHARGLLGLNARNADFISPRNPRAHYPRVDDKCLTKSICEKHGIPVPETYAVIECQGDIPRFQEMIRDRQDFVIKPASGSEGRGIIVVTDHDGETFTTAGQERLSAAEVRYHLSTTLSGLYSLGGQTDSAILEQRIIRHSAFENVAVRGTPDIRVVLYRSVPVMAMVRLPTAASRGRANLHQGAIAAAVNLATGTTFGGVCKNRVVEVHPDTGAKIAGLQIPFWDKLLTAAINLADALEMGYIGVDFVLDAKVGPVVLEANARPGLAIQIANRTGLLPRLDFIDGLSDDALKPDRRIALVAEIAKMW